MISLVQEQPLRLVDLVSPLGVAGTPMGIRIGIAAVLEEFAGSPAFAPAIQPLLALLQADSALVRLDACHLLGLSGDEHVRPAISALLQDPDPEVREVARESLDGLDGDD